MTEIEAQLGQLHDLKNSLARLLYTEAGLDKEKIFLLLSQYNDSLDYLHDELEFQFGLDLDKPVHTQVELVAEYDSLRDFMNRFQKNLITKQLSQREDQLANFEDLKRAKYNREVAADTADNAIENHEEPEVVSKDAKIMNTTRKITSKLVTSSQILQSSLVQSQLNIEELEIQGDSLSRFAERNDVVGGMLTRSEVFINDIRLSSMKDKKRMYYALAFFALCVFKVFWSRLLKWPVILSWRIVWYSTRTLFSTLGLVSKPLKVEPLKASNIVQAIGTTTTTSAVGVASDVVETVSSLSEAITTTMGEFVSIVSNVAEELATDTFEEVLGRIIDEL